eukprot:COSAG04_NODE_3106_length_3161_cov_2.430764_3_plen_94_part_00
MDTRTAWYSVPLCRPRGAGGSAVATVFSATADASARGWHLTGGLGPRRETARRALMRPSPVEWHYFSIYMVHTVSRYVGARLEQHKLMGWKPA